MFLTKEISKLNEKITNLEKRPAPSPQVQLPAPSASRMPNKVLPPPPPTKKRPLIVPPTFNTQPQVPVSRKSFKSAHPQGPLSSPVVVTNKGMACCSVPPQGLMVRKFVARLTSGNV